MDSEIVSKLQLSESEQARLAAFGSEITTPDEAKAIATNAAQVHLKLRDHAYWAWDKGYKKYWEYVETYRVRFLLGLHKTYPVAVLGSGYFASFKGQVSDKWQNEPWEANKAYIANFLNDDRGKSLKKKNEDLRLYFEELPFIMEKLRIQLKDGPGDEVKEVLATADAAVNSIAKVNQFGNSWNTFSQDAELIRDKAEIAVDSKTKTYLTERVKILGESSKTLSDAMAIYVKIFDDEKIMDYPT